MFLDELIDGSWMEARLSPPDVARAKGAVRRAVERSLDEGAFDLLKAVVAHEETALHACSTAGMTALLLPGDEDAVLWALFHDVGKARVPPEILFAKRKLTPEEFSVVQTHAAAGGEMILEFSGSPLWSGAAEVARLHHKNNGGYPLLPYAPSKRVAGVIDAISMGDSLSAACDKRSYAPARPHMASVVAAELASMCVAADSDDARGYATRSIAYADHARKKIAAGDEWWSRSRSSMFNFSLEPLSPSFAFAR